MFTIEYAKGVAEDLKKYGRMNVHVFWTVLMTNSNMNLPY